MGQDSPAASSLSPVSGTYHLTVAGETTGYEFARAILDEAAQISPDVPWFCRGDPRPPTYNEANNPDHDS